MTLTVWKTKMRGQVVTARGSVSPDQLGRVQMHEHLHVDIFDWDKQALLLEEQPITPERRDMLFREGVSYLKQCAEHGMFAWVEATPPPWRAWPTFYREAGEASGTYPVLCTGCYREVEPGTYWVKKPEDTIWPFARQATIEELTEYFTREIIEGIHDTDVHAGAIKLGNRSQFVELTPIEEKCFRAGARAQKATGVHITTHCVKVGAQTSQLRVLADEGVDLRRVVIGHTAGHLIDKECRQVCLEWMKEGANFLPTNLAIGEDGGERWRPLVEAFHEIFDAGLGEHLVLGLDCAFCSERGPFRYCVMPPPPFLYMFVHTLPAFRKLGLTPAEEDAIMLRNPQRILPVQ